MTKQQASKLERGFGVIMKQQYIFITQESWRALFDLVVNDIFKCVDRFWQHAKINEHILGHEWIMIPGTVNILNQVWYLKNK